MRFAQIVAILTAGSMLTSCDVEVNEPTTSADTQVEVTTLSGNFTVYCDLVTSDTGGQTGKIDDVSKIEFHEQYVIVVSRNGAGKLVPVSQIKVLRWDSK